MLSVVLVTMHLLKQVATHPNKFGTPFFYKEEGPG